ncbi:hypothetical protein E6C27_scaffold90G00580 [Cucumis melo var. makuwa]|uniref:Ty3-gypsy retrotransposon protein n=1 Tax=Cucumis melo var. makuwa TaxID=1194695 RepID=A0A5A7VEI7_CUCMM|nr:hypothetical protein E6C27_scaffold90G00580 [Cucumis melo var. makuwa]
MPPPTIFNLLLLFSSMLACSRRTLPRLSAVVEARPSSELRQSFCLAVQRLNFTFASVRFRRRPSQSPLRIQPTPPPSLSVRFHRRASPSLVVRRVEADPIVELLQAAKCHCLRAPKDPSLMVGSLGVDSIKGHNQVSGSVTASCSLCAIMCNELFTDRHRCPDVLCIVVILVSYVVNWNCMSMDYKVLMLGCGVTVSFIYGVVYLTDILIGVFFGITRLIGVSFGITRLIRASFEITRLMCKGTARGRPKRGKKDA